MSALRPLLLAASIAASSSALAQYTVKNEDLATGSRIRSIAASSDLYPLDRRYEEFSDAEKARFRSYYEAMPEGDEPPFPAAGMRHVILEVSRIGTRLQSRGEVSMHVWVDAKGQATKVDLLEYDDLDAAKAIARVLVKTDFKPARCAQAACAMAFPFSAVLNPSP